MSPRICAVFGALFFLLLFFGQTTATSYGNETNEHVPQDAADDKPSTIGDVDAAQYDQTGAHDDQKQPSHQGDSEIQQASSNIEFASHADEQPPENRSIAHLHENDPELEHNIHHDDEALWNHDQHHVENNANDGDGEQGEQDDVAGPPGNEGGPSNVDEGDQNVGETESDVSVRVDDETLQKVNSERAELSKKLNQLEMLRKRMETKHELLKRVRELQQRINSSVAEEQRIRDEETRAEEEYKLAVMKKNATSDERESIAKEREKVEKLLEELKSEKSSYETEYSKMEEDRKKVDLKEKELKLNHDKLVKELERVVGKFRDKGFHTWLNTNLHALPPVVRETILKTSDVLSPVVEGVEEVGALNDELSRQTADTLTWYIPIIQRSPFYAGLIFYIFLLCPTVLAIWLVMKVRARLSLLTVEHYVIAINLYFGVMSTVCAIMTLLGKVDILVVFRHRARHVAEAFMLIHGSMFVLHLVLHGLTAYVSGSRKDFVQYIVMSCVGLHFFIHAYKRTILNYDPNVGAPAYVVYSVIFLYILYDRGVHIIEAVVRGRKAGLSAFGTFPADYGLKKDLATLPTGRVSGRDSGRDSARDLGRDLVRDSTRSDTTVYFAGLPVFSAPSQSALNDAKTI